MDYILLLCAMLTGAITKAEETVLFVHDMCYKGRALQRTIGG